MKSFKEPKYITSMKPGCVPHLSITLHSMSPISPAFPFLNISFRLLPVVLQLYWGYWVNATARLTPSSFILFIASSVNGLVYRNAT